MKKIVIKIGTKVLTGKDGNLDESIIESLVNQVSEVRNKGISVLIVTSGAIGAGMGALNIKKRPHDLNELQSLASIGQVRLMDFYNKYFERNKCLTGQILLTQDDFNDRERYLNIKHTIQSLLEKKAIPVINENDAIQTDEIKCGDNDRLSSLVAGLTEADMLIMLTDVDGLLDREGRLLREMSAFSGEARKHIRQNSSFLGTGGMETKINAAEFAAKSGIECFIANGRKEGIILKILDGKGLFTRFKATASKMAARKRWIGFGSKTKGTLTVDEGAKEALIKKNKSLLPAGVIDKKGNFRMGDTVGILDKNGKEFARGIVNYSSGDLMKIKGAKTKDIEAILGYKDHDEVIHKDNLVIL